MLAEAGANVVMADVQKDAVEEDAHGLSGMNTAAVHSRFTEPPPEVIEAIYPTPRRLRSTAVSSIVLPLGPPVSPEIC